MNYARANLAFLIRDRETNPTQVARATGVPQPTIKRILDGTSGDPRTETLTPLAKFFNVALEDLRSVDLEAKARQHKQYLSLQSRGEDFDAGEFLYPDLGEKAEPATTNLDEIYVRIPRLSLQVAAGNGTEPDQVKLRSMLVFRREWLRGKGLSPEHLEVYEATGDSMAPYIENGDVLLVDTSAEKPKSGEVWVLWQDAPLGVRVKRLLYRENGDIIIRSDNPDKALYPDEIVVGPQGDTVKTVGKVVWRGG